MMMLMMMQCPTLTENMLSAGAPRFSLIAGSLPSA